jgi:hypothetical protein
MASVPVALVSIGGTGKLDQVRFIAGQAADCGRAAA